MVELHSDARTIGPYKWRRCGAWHRISLAEFKIAVLSPDFVSRVVERIRERR